MPPLKSGASAKALAMAVKSIGGFAFISSGRLASKSLGDGLSFFIPTTFLAK